MGPATPFGRTAFVLVVAFLSLGLSGPVAHAGTADCRITGDPSSSRRGRAGFSGTVSYDDANRLLTFILENTSAKARLTGLAFKLDGGDGAYLDADDASSRGDDDAFDDARRGRVRAVKAGGFGRFDAGAALDGHWGRGKGAKRGVGAGDGRTFVFRIDGDHDASTAADLLGGADAPIVASFKSKRKDWVAGAVSVVSDDDSPSPGRDLPTTPSPAPGGEVVAIPLPPAVWTGLATLGLLALRPIRNRLRFS